MRSRTPRVMPVWSSVRSARQSSRARCATCELASDYVRWSAAAAAPSEPLRTIAARRYGQTPANAGRRDVTTNGRSSTPPLPAIPFQEPFPGRVPLAGLGPARSSTRTASGRRRVGTLVAACLIGGAQPAKVERLFVHCLIAESARPHADGNSAAGPAYGHTLNVRPDATRPARYCYAGRIASAFASRVSDSAS